MPVAQSFRADVCVELVPLMLELDRWAAQQPLLDGNASRCEAYFFAFGAKDSLVAVARASAALARLRDPRRGRRARRAQLPRRRRAAQGRRDAAARVPLRLRRIAAAAAVADTLDAAREAEEMDEAAAACALARKHDVSLHAAKAAHHLAGDAAAAEDVLVAWRDEGVDLRRCPRTDEAVCRCAARTCPER